MGVGGPLTESEMPRKQRALNSRDSTPYNFPCLLRYSPRKPGSSPEQHRLCSCPVSEPPAPGQQTGKSEAVEGGKDEGEAAWLWRVSLLHMLHFPWLSGVSSPHPAGLVSTEQGSDGSLLSLLNL